MSSPRRIAAVAIAAVTLVVVLIGGMLVVVIGTTFGARQALRFAAARVPGELAVGHVAGTLYSGLELGDIRFRRDTLDARIGSLAVEPSWGDLLRGRYVLSRLHAGNGRIEIPEPPLEDAPDPRAGGAPADGSESNLRLPDIPPGIEVRDLGVDDFDIDARGTPIRIDTLRGSIADGSIRLDRLVVEGAGATLAASGEAELDSTHVSGTLRGSVRLPVDGEDAPAGADAADRTAGRADSVELDIAFGFDEDAGDGRWQASLDWSRLEWRRPDGEALASPGGRLRMRPGADDALDVELDAALEGAPLPAPASIAANAAVANGIVDVRHARLALAGAEVLAGGAFELESRSGYVSVDYDGVDPSLLVPSRSGDLHGRIDVAIATLPELTVGGSGRLGGELDGRPLDAHVVASYSSDTLSIESGDIALDGGRVVVDGMLSPDAADLRFSASLPRIGNWYPPVTGAATATGSIAGDTDDPRVDIDFEGIGLEWQGSLPPLERVALGIGGTRAAHVLRLDAETELGRVLIEAEQHYADGGVDGRLVESVLEPRDAGVWRLAEPARYSARTDRIELGLACLAGPANASVCATLDQARLSLAARDVPNALAAPWLPDGFVVDGTTDADADVTFAAPLTGTLTLRHDALRVGVRGGADGAPGDAADEVVPLLDLGDVVLRAALDADALDVELTGGRSRAGAESLLAPTALAGRLILSPPAGEGRLEGFASAQLTELGLLGALVDGVDALAGVVDARLALSGTLESPRVSGLVSASELAAELPALGIAVTEGRLSAGVDEIAELDTVPFEAELCSIGCARIAGRLTLSERDDWTLAAIVEGDDVLILDLPELRATATPRLDVRATPELATIAGTLSIPEGSIEIEDVPRTAVRPARETVVHGREAPERDAEGLPIPLSINLDASLGDVRFEGLGLEAQLAGTLDVEHTPAGDWILQGTTTIEEGTFSAYGQTLTIQQGLLVFTGPPDNPALDIRALRVVNDADVTLAITGTAENPQSQVFSEAGLSESEAFAQLLTGRSLEELDESDPEALERAAIGLGLRRALPTLGRIGAALGLDELGVQSPGQAEGAVVAGRQIGDDVYIRYRHGLFDDFSGLELIYRMTERFRLRTQTGTAQSIDVIYEVDPGDPDTLAEDIEDIDVAIQDGPTDIVGPEIGAD